MIFVSFPIAKNNTHRPAELQCVELPNGKLSVRLLGRVVGFVNDEHEAFGIPDVQDYCIKHNYHAERYS